MTSKGLGFAVPLALLAAACARPGGTAAARPNVLLVVVDTLRADRLPLHDPTLATAPFLAELAAGAVVFERAWSPSSWTGPATASLFTGVTPRQHGLHTNLTTLEKRAASRVRVNRIPATLETIPEFLAGLGYRTFAVTDNPNIVAELGFAEGFERFANFDYESAERVNAELAAWRDEIRASEPWFVYLHYMDPHVPYHRRAPWFQEPAEGGELAAKLAAYDSEIAFVDQHLRAAFELLGVDEDTLVIFTADHGEEFGEHGGWNHFFQLYNELTHVPLLLQHPGAKPLRARVSENASLLDVLPTLRAILGTPPHPDDAGRDLTRAYLAPPAAEPERVLFGHRRSASAEKEYVLSGTHKLIVTRPQDRHELYDLASDPGETRDLSAERPELTAELLRRLREFHRTSKVWERETTELELQASDLRRLEELGYAGDGDADAHSGESDER